MRELARRLMGGDVAAENELFEKLRVRFTAIAKRRVGRVDAEDVAHEACVVVLQKYRELARSVEFEPWAYAVLRNKIGNHLQKQTGRRDLNVGPIEIEAFSEPRPAADESGLALALRDCFAQLVRSYPRYARVLNLTHQGFKSEDICSRLGISRNYLYVLLNRARSRLRACLQKKRPL